MSVFKLNFQFDKNINSFFSVLFFSTLYVFMNILQLDPILSEFKISFTKKKAFVLSLFYSLFLTLFLVVFVLFLKSHEFYTKNSMPILSYFGEVGGVGFAVFAIGLVLALVSSLLSSLIGVKRFFLNKTTNMCATLFAIVLSLMLSIFDFSFFVSVVYPLIGFINFIIFVFL